MIDWVLIVCFAHEWPLKVTKTNIKVICTEMHDVPDYKDYDYMESLGYKNFYNSSPDGDQHKDVEWHKWFARKDVELDLNFLKEL